MWLMNVSNGWSIVSVSFKSSTHLSLSKQFIGPTFRTSSQDDVRCSTASICLWLSHSYINNAIKSLVVLKIVMLLMDGMHRCGNIVLCCITARVWSWGRPRKWSSGCGCVLPFPFLSSSLRIMRILVVTHPPGAAVTQCDWVSSPRAPESFPMIPLGRSFTLKSPKVRNDVTTKVRWQTSWVWWGRALYHIVTALEPKLVRWHNRLSPLPHHLCLRRAFRCWFICYLHWATKLTNK